MGMKIWKYDELPEKNGSLVMLYGESGVGKSVSSLQTAECPILYIMTEPRDVKNFVRATGRDDIDVDFVFYEGWDSLIEFTLDHSNFEKYNTIILDSVSHLISINFSDEILEESYEALDAKKKADKAMTMRAKMSQEGYGTLATQMLRFTNAISKLTQSGKVVIFLARVESNPKYNRSYSAAPSLKGQEYSKNFPGFFDFIGLVETRSKEGLTIYPPSVSFEGDGSFMAKWTGLRPEGGVANKVLNVDKILKASRGSNGKKAAEVAE